MNSSEFSHLDAAVIHIDEQNKILSWEGKCEEIFLWKSEEIVGKTITETIVPERFRIQHEIGFKNFIETKKRTLSDLNHKHIVNAVRKDNVEIPICIILSISNNNFVAIIIDISNHKRTIEYGKMKINLETEFQKLTNSFLTDLISHEINTPLQTLILSADEINSNYLNYSNMLKAFNWSIHQLQMFMSTLIDIEKNGT